MIFDFLVPQSQKQQDIIYYINVYIATVKHIINSKLRLLKSRSRGNEVACVIFAKRSLNYSKAKSSNRSPRKNF